MAKKVKSYDELLDEIEWEEMDGDGRPINQPEDFTYRITCELCAEDIQEIVEQIQAYGSVSKIERGPIVRTVLG